MFEVLVIVTQFVNMAKSSDIKKQKLKLCETHYRKQI